MRTPFLIAALIAMAVGLGAIYWSLSTASSIIADLTDTSRFVEVIKPTPTVSEKPVAQKDNSLVYKGQALGYLGDPKIIAGYPKEFVNRYRERLDTVVGMVRQRPKEEVYWIEAGIIKKQFDNYTGARDAWEYALILNPRSSVAYHNLANLHAFYLRDFQRAEQNYQIFMSLDRFSAQPYLVLSDFYKDFYKEKSDLADDVLLAGLKYLPNDPNLILNLAKYYESAGDNNGAIEYFERFLKLPGLTDAQIEAIQRELAALRSL